MAKKSTSPGEVSTGAVAEVPTPGAAKSSLIEPLDRPGRQNSTSQASEAAEKDYNFPQELDDELIAEIDAVLGAKPDIEVTSPEPRPSTPEDKVAQEQRWKSTAQGRKMARREVEQTALIILSMLDGLAGMALGPEAQMNEFEKDMIREPLERILARLDIVSSGILAKYIDPIMLTIGLIAWGNRIARQRKDKLQDEQEYYLKMSEEPEPPKREPGGNNKAPHEFDLSVMSAEPIIHSTMQGDFIK